MLLAEGSNGGDREGRPAARPYPAGPNLPSPSRSAKLSKLFSGSNDQGGEGWRSRRQPAVVPGCGDAMRLLGSGAGPPSGVTTSCLARALALGRIPGEMGARHLEKLCTFCTNVPFCVLERMVAEGYADLIALCRPFIREPDLVKRLQEGLQAKSTCISCNQCTGPSRSEPIGCRVLK